ncbi:NUDIX domain-containing protein [Halobacteriovorax sp.]|uniref:NUDIX domain-containing protein n=1 Tax=Halobacteriovorax sp. TaxID=2020862 RepID=UPI0035616F39
MVTPVAIIILIKDITENSCKFWMQERVEDGPLNGLLEFPGGKIEKGESSVLAAKREFSEEANVDIASAPLFKIQSFDYKDRSVCLFIHFSNGEGINPDNGSWFEFDYNEKSLAYKGRLPEVNYEIIDDLLNYIKKHISADMLENIWAQRS